ncbi:MAG: type 4a pilus biogenesis protein PilO [Planctomycetota bacterium]|nr:type 4a pilus biogenesis protein PilO [Planctomycetota bacterium]
MNERRWWIGIIAGGSACALGLGALLWWQRGQIEEGRAAIAGTKTSIESSKKLIEGTSGLEREVIVLRELTEVMKGMLPDNDDVNNLVRTLQKFSQDSGVRISGLKKKTIDNKRDKNDFDKVGYTLSLEGDAFQFLDFLDLLESHSRFMRVPSFRMTAAQRNQLEKEGVPSHKVSIDVETYVYEPKKDQKDVRIDGYERKRDLLLGEINRRREGLTVATYNYRGSRGRRDPWIDPRVPTRADSASTLTVQEQMDIVQKLAERTQGVLTKWDQVKAAENVIVEMMTRSEMEQELAALEENVRKVVSDKLIAYVPSDRRLQNEVVLPLEELRGQFSQSEVGKGPSEVQLKEIETTMVHSQGLGDYKQMLDAFAVIDNRLTAAEGDPVKKPLVDRLRELAYEARTVLDFEKIKVEVGGVVLIEGSEPVALINGKSLTVGDLINPEMIVRAINREEIEFIFRGVVFARRF